MIFPSIEAAQAWSTKYKRPIFVEIQGANGVLEVWPGGRKIWWDDTLSERTIERKRRDLTPDSEFDNEWAKCRHCGCFVGIDPHEPDCEEMSL